MYNTNILLESGTNELEIVEFYLDEVLGSGENYRGFYGINVAKVLEIIRLPKVTEMPENSHPSVLGAFNQRNQIIPLVDLSMWLAKNMKPNEAPKVIVTEFNRVVNAFKVSGVTRIHRLSWEQIEPPSLQVQQLSGDTITGVVKIENRVVFILDMEKIIGDINPRLALKIESDVPQEEKCHEYRVLIADDSTSIRRMIGSALEKQGFIVERTINGLKAWEKLEEWKRAAEDAKRPIHDFVNIIISDIEMPVMDGHNLTKRIKDDPLLQKLPVVLFSSLITESLRHKGEAVGADFQVSKPDLQALAEKAKELADKYMCA